MSTSVTLLGGSGLTGSAALRSFLRFPASAPIDLTTLTRSPLSAPFAPTPPSTYINRVHSDLFATSSASDPLAKHAQVFVSCLGTTRADAGGLDKQRVIDVDLGLALAKKAKQDGAEQCVVVSAAGASASSRLPYSKMKGELEEGLKGMGFKSVVILHPGMLLGERDPNKPFKGFGEGLAQKFFYGLRYVHAPVGSICIDADDVGDCIAHFAVNPPSDAVKYVSNSEIASFAKEHRAWLATSNRT